MFGGKGAGPTKVGGTIEVTTGILGRYPRRTMAWDIVGYASTSKIWARRKIGDTFST